MSKITSQPARLIACKNLKHNYYSYTFGPFDKAITCKPGQFVHLQLPSRDIYFRRAMSVASANSKGNTVEIIFKVFGRGTRLLSQFKAQESINILGPLGQPFAKPLKGETVLLVAGGVGFPPLMYLAESLRQGKTRPQMEFFYGGKSAPDLVELPRIRKLGVKLHTATDDGSHGEKGLVTKLLLKYLTKATPGQKMRLYACGPDPMLKAVDEIGQKFNIPGQLSLEAPMPCGIGVCLGCVVKLRAGGHARVCVEGPTFRIGEVVL